MVIITQLEELIGLFIAITGTIFIPSLVFFSRLWNRVGILEQQMKTSIEVRKDLQDNILPIFHQARIDIEVIKERVQEICEDIETIKKDHERGRFD